MGDQQEVLVELEEELLRVNQLLALDPNNEQLKQIYEGLHENLIEIQKETTNQQSDQQEGSVGAAKQQIGPTLPTGRKQTQDLQGNNQFIHPNNMFFDAAPDFVMLAAKYPQLKQYLIFKEQSDSRMSIDFGNPRATRQLTAVLLEEHLGIKWWIPDGYLVPPLTNRMNYIHWIEDLLRLSSNNNNSIVKGLDIGCGANCIYPVLGAAMNAWNFVATDIDSNSVKIATEVVQQNDKLKGKIDVRLVGEKSGFFVHALTFQNLKQIQESENQQQLEKSQESNKDLSQNNESKQLLNQNLQQQHSLDLNKIQLDKFDFSMCNPPFFEDTEDHNAGTESEMSCEGGEEAFVKQMIQESQHEKIRNQITWFTTMLGRKQSFKNLKPCLQNIKEITAVRTTEFLQGRHTRWGIAWSFSVPPSIAEKPIVRPAIQLKVNNNNNSQVPSNQINEQNQSLDSDQSDMKTGKVVSFELGVNLNQFGLKNLLNLIQNIIISQGGQKVRLQQADCTVCFFLDCWQQQAEDQDTELQQSQQQTRKRQKIVVGFEIQVFQSDNERQFEIVGRLLDEKYLKFLPRLRQVCQVLESDLKMFISQKLNGQQ